MLIIFGGSFNPVTIAHYQIVTTLLEKYENANIVVLPVGNRYPKKDLIDGNHRYQMLKLLFNNNHRVIISDYEIKQPFTGTINTLKHFEKKDHDLYYVIGSDNIKDLNTWIDYENLLKKYKFIIINRHNDNQQVITDINKYQHLWKEMPTIIDFNYNISSSNIRYNVEQYKKDLNIEVYEYIKKMNLYQ